jgi:hypothetical protein
LLKVDENLTMEVKATNTECPNPYSNDEEPVNQAENQNDQLSEQVDNIEASSIDQQTIQESPHVNRSAGLGRAGELQLPFEAEQSPNNAEPELDTTKLSEEDKINLKLVTTIQYLVIIQPLVGLTAALVSMIIMITFDLSHWQYFGAGLPGVALAAGFAATEIRLISRLISCDLIPTIIYNILSKLLYLGSSTLLMALASSPTSNLIISLFIGIELIHIGFFGLSLWYRKKQEIDQYVGKLSLNIASECIESYTDPTNCCYWSCFDLPR